MSSTDVQTPAAWLLPGCALCMALGVLLGRATDTLLPTLLCALAAALALLLCPAGARRAAALLTAAAAGMVCGQLAYHPALPEEGTCRVTGVVADEWTVREDNGQASTLLRSVRVEGGQRTYGAIWSFYMAQDAQTELPAPGSAVTLTASLYHPEGAVNPGGYNQRETLLAKGVTIGLYGCADLEVSATPRSLTAWCASVRHAWTLRLREVMDEETAAYAAAILLGVRNGLDEDDCAAFRRLGIAHVLAVSGYHVGVLCAALTFLLRRLRVPRWWQLLPVGALLALYCMLTGMHAPVVRASLLSVLTLAGARLGRKTDGLHLLSACAIVILLFAPAQLTSASFQLSFAAMLGLILITPLLSRVLSRWMRPRLLREALSAAVGAQVGALLPQLYWFQELSLMSVLSNLLLTGLFSMLLTVDWIVLACMHVPFVSTLAGRAASCLTSLLLGAVRLLDHAPWAVIWTRQANPLTAAGWLVLLVSLSIVWKRIGRRQLFAATCALAVLVMSVLPWHGHRVRYTQLSVGRADAAVIEDQGTTAVVDTGSGSALAVYLKQRRLPVDALFLTHLHKDHAGGLEALLSYGIPVRVCYLPVGAEEADVSDDMRALLRELVLSGAVLRSIARGDRVALPSGEILALFPEEGRCRPGGDANSRSLALHVRLMDTTLLLMGDLAGAYEHYAAVPADVLKAAHHGASDSCGEAFLDSVAPSLLLVSCGNRSLSQGFCERTAHIPTLSTARSGCITITMEAGGYHAVPFR